MTHSSPGTEVERAADEYAAESWAPEEAEAAFLAGARWMAQKSAGDIDHQAFLCHTHDAHGKGRERGLLDATKIIAALLPDKEQTR